MSQSTREKGRHAEQIACEFLSARGLVPLQKNFQTKTGEIDLIMQDGKVIVFVEVRSRKSNNHLHVLETIDNRKRKRIIKTSMMYLQKYGFDNFNHCRFDIVLLTGCRNSYEVQWIKNAFET